MEKTFEFCDRCNQQITAVASKHGIGIKLFHSIGGWGGAEEDCEVSWLVCNKCFAEYKSQTATIVDWAYKHKPSQHPQVRKAEVEKMLRYPR